MAIRGPRDRPEVRPEQQAGVKPAREQPASPLQRLQDFGSARTPQEARKLIAEVLASLRAAGFPVPPTGNAEGQLGAALRLFQQARGLPANGQLDRATHEALVDSGILPRSDAAEAKDKRDAGKVSEAPSRFVTDIPRGQPRAAELGLPRGGPVPDGAKSTQGVELEQLIDKNAREKPPEVDLKSFLSSLRAAGFGAAGKGADQLKDALKKLQRAEGLPQTGQIDAKTAEALVKRGIVDERVLPLAMTAQDPSSQRAPDAATTQHAQTAKEGDARGTPAGGEAGDVKGRGDRDGRGAGVDGKGGDGQSATSGTHAATGGEGAQGTGDVEDPWAEDARDGNAPAGDEDIDDERRGHANVDDRDALDAGAGHWEVAKISEQIAAALAAIVRDDDGKGAATYAWDFTLYRPGVYGAKQPAEKLFHLVVAKASAFDALWEQARAALNGKLIELEPESPLVDAEDFARALRVARVREPSPSEPSPSTSSSA